MPNYKQRHINNHFDSNIKPIFRGQGNSDWKLIPNASRNSINMTINEQIKFEVRLLLYFLDYCDKTGIQVPGHISNTRNLLQGILEGTNGKGLVRWPTEEYYDILAFSQHYGVSTRLLDWSKRSFIAAYFSASEAVKNIIIDINNGKKPNLTVNLAIWILESAKVDNYNKQFLNSSDISRVPFSIINIPSNVNFHIAAQQGCFTIFRHVDEDIDSTTPWTMNPPKFSKEKTVDTSNMEYANYLHKWTLPHSEAHKLLNLCEMYNVNAASVYPSAIGAGYAVKDLINIQTIERYLKNES